MKIGEEFYPSSKMMMLYVTYLLMAIIPLYALGIGISLVVAYYASVFAAEVFALAYLLPLTVITLFALFWIPKYFKSIKYLFTETDVRVEIGVWWKERHAIPYSRIMNVDTIQGPISRIYGLGTVDIYTAGYTGVAGGTGGPKARRAEASLINVPDFHDLREQVLEVVRGKPLFGLPAAATDNISEQMLSELKEIRKLMETKS
ncbi:MAG: PH domain-containing protein [Candidatus Methanomethylicaceae archaeon]|jgi:membrane protein YdbS with pleckstrin-like domain